MNTIKNYRTAARLALAAAMAGNLLALPLASQAATYSYTDLNPSGFKSSRANDNSGSQQVGYGYSSVSGYYEHALLWSGTASSAVDLNPSGFTSSQANGNSGTQQVGNGSGSATGNNNHAFLWSGTAGSVVDLNPSGFTQSYGFGISGSQQVGFGSGSASGNYKHALLWSGTASSVVDLGSLLSSDYSSSVALDIDANGNVVGYATYILTGQEHAILWTVAVVPRLTISLSNQKVVLSWPTNASGFTLQSTANLVSPAVWTTVFPGPVIVNGQNAVTNTISGTQKFYRLIQ